jgi:hypothetical protein
MSIRVDVTTEDIEHGDRQSYVTCPVALAVRRVMGRLIEVSNRGWVITEDEEANADLPDDVTERIIDYDEGGAMEPFSFELPEWPSGWAFPNGHPDPEDHDATC